MLGLPCDGISLVRDTVRNMRQAGDPILQLQSGFWALPGDAEASEDEPDLSDLHDMILYINGVEYDVFVIGSGPAVLLQR